jgi:RimJ/RimL family protein N-acetyltransferase
VTGSSCRPYALTITPFIIPGLTMRIWRQRSELGILIGDKRERNKGFGTEAIRLICDYGFRILNLRNIMLKIFSFNESAITVYRKAGFVEFGRRTKSYFFDFVFHDEIYMEIVRKDHL